MKIDPGRALARERVEVDPGNLTGPADQVAGPEMPVVIGVLEGKMPSRKVRARNRMIRQASMTRSPQDGGSARPVSGLGRDREVSGLGRGSGGLTVDITRSRETNVSQVIAKTNQRSQSTGLAPPWSRLRGTSGGFGGFVEVAYAADG